MKIELEFLPTKNASAGMTAVTAHASDRDFRTAMEGSERVAVPASSDFKGKNPGARLLPAPWAFRSTAGLRMVDVRTMHELGDHAAEWNRLLLSSSVASPMLSFAQISAFLETQIKPTETWLCVFAYESDQLVGVLPLIAGRAFGMLGYRILCLKTPYDNLHTGSVDGLTKPGREDVMEGILDYLSEMPRTWPIIRMREIPPQSATMICLGRAENRLAAFHFVSGAENYIEVPKDFSTFHSRLSSNFRRQLKRCGKKLADLGNVRFLCDERSRPINENHERFETVEDAGWKGAGNTSVRMMPENSQLYRLAAHRFNDNGWMQWNFLEVGGQSIAAHYGVRINRKLFLLKIGYDERFAACSPGNLLLEKLIEHASESGEVDEINCVADCVWHKSWAMKRRLWHDVIILPQVPLMRGLARFLQSKPCRDRIARRLSGHSLTAGKTADINQGGGKDGPADSPEL